MAGDEEKETKQELLKVDAGVHQLETIEVFTNIASGEKTNISDKYTKEERMLILGRLAFKDDDKLAEYLKRYRIDKSQRFNQMLTSFSGLALAIMGALVNIYSGFESTLVAIPLILGGLTLSLVSSFLTFGRDVSMGDAKDFFRSSSKINGKENPDIKFEGNDNV